MAQRCTRWERGSPGSEEGPKVLKLEFVVVSTRRDHSSFRLNKYVKNPSNKCFLRGLVVAGSLPLTAKHIKLRYEIPSIIIHTVNDSDEDDTIDDDDTMKPLRYH